MKNIFRFTIIAFMLAACNQRSIKEKIAERIEDKCKDEKNCAIDIKDVTEFKWDKMYIFSEGASLEAIDKALGFHYPYFEDIASRVVFVLDNKVIYHEDDFPYPGAKPIAGVTFQIYNDSIPHYIFSSNSAVFSVKKTIVKGYKYYDLIPQNR